jgi:MFS superfamily sulfate permease-like transporter
MFSEAIRGLVTDRRELRWIVIAAEPVTDVDTTAADMLEELDGWLNERGISLVFAELKDPVREKIERYELTRTIDPAHFFPTVDAAVEEYIRQTGATWTSGGVTG